MKKFELTTNTKMWFGRKLFQIKALISFGNVNKGELGGYVEKEENLSHNGDAWVYGDARVYGNAWVCGDARVCDNADYLIIGPIGSRNGFTTFFRCKNESVKVVCGCFFGTVDEFAAKVTKTHGNNAHAKNYQAAIESAKVKFTL